VQDLGEEPAFHEAEPSMMPKSTAATVPVFVDQQVALVHVGMEEAVAHGMAQERAQM